MKTLSHITPRCSFVSSSIKNLVKLILPILAAGAAYADSYATLAGSGDSITLEKGQTALVMSGAGVITYSKKGKPCSYIRLSKDVTRTLRETTKQALPLVGPAKITVRSCDGYLGMRIVSTCTCKKQTNQSKNVIVKK